MRKTLRKRNNKNKKSKKYGGLKYKLGTSTTRRTGPGSVINSYQFSDEMNPITPKITNSLPEVIETNLYRVDTSPNRNDDYKFHNLFMTHINLNDVDDFVVIEKVINNNFLSIVENLNRSAGSTSNNNLRKEYTVNDIKLNEFSIKFLDNNSKNIFIQGKIYVTDFNKINKPLRQNLISKLNEDVVGEIAKYSTG
jgi:hypothetical protein